MDCCPIAIAPRSRFALLVNGGQGSPSFERASLPILIANFYLNAAVNSDQFLSRLLRVGGGNSDSILDFRLNFC